MKMPANEFLGRAFAGGIGRVIEAASGHRVPIRTGEPNPVNLLRQQVWLRQEFAPPADSAVLAGAAESDWKLLGSTVSLAAGIKPEGDPQKIALEFVRHGMSRIARWLTEEAGSEIACSGDLEPGDAPDSLQSAVELVFDLGDGSQPRVLIAANEPFLGRIAAMLEKPAIALPSTPLDQRPLSSGFERLHDVELGIAVSFGKAKVSIKDVLNLGVGSVVELDRMANDPVDIVVNHHVIATGEVVVVDGNLGVRILSVAGAAEVTESPRT